VQSSAPEMACSCCRVVLAVPLRVRRTCRRRGACAARHSRRHHCRRRRRVAAPERRGVAPMPRPAPPSTARRRRTPSPPAPRLNRRPPCLALRGIQTARGDRQPPEGGGLRAAPASQRRPSPTCAPMHLQQFRRGSILPPGFQEALLPEQAQQSTRS
jgi:hypothetical protein